MATASTTEKPLTKAEILANIANATNLTRKDVAAMFDALTDQVKTSLSDQGPGTFTIPGLPKIEKKRVPARLAKNGVPHPFKPGELMDVAARPASNKVKVRPLMFRTRRRWSLARIGACWSSGFARPRAGRISPARSLSGLSPGSTPMPRTTARMKARRTASGRTSLISGRCPCPIRAPGYPRNPLIPELATLC